MQLVHLRPHHVASPRGTLPYLAWTHLTFLFVTLPPQLAEEADGKGKRGRKRKNGDLEDDEEVGEVEREDRQKQREMMKEMRARRAAEKLVESKYGEEVTKQKSRIKQVIQEIDQL